MSLHHIVRTFFAIVFTFSLFVLPQKVFAATVVGVKGKKVLVNLQGEPALKGDIFYLLDKSGKKKALIKIMKVKGNKALALLGKGKAQKGYTLKYRPKKGSTAKRKGKKSGGGSDQAAADDSSSDSSSSGDAGGMYFGVMLGFSQNSMDVELQDDSGNSRGSTSLSGNGFSAKGMVDYNLFSGVWFRGMFGVEQFNASGEASCGASPFTDTCTAEIMYLSLDLWGRYVFSDGGFRPWAGGGFSLMFPLSQTATALDESSITNTSVMSFGLGVDWFTSPTFYIPISVEYGLLPSSDTVSANTIAIRLGAGFSF